MLEELPLSAQDLPAQELPLPRSHWLQDLDGERDFLGSETRRAVRDCMPVTTGAP